MIHSHRHINQQYNKALFIVQHLPISSNVQPTKEQKLQLYSLYKQASQGDINTPRPGIFDVVGRSKWDAWKKLEGMSELEAKHRYVQMLLQVAKEALKKPAGRAQAQQIIQSFAAASSDNSSEEESDDEESSIDEEERDYLNEIQKSEPIRKHIRSSSRASSQTMMTAPTELRRLSYSSASTHKRPISVASTIARHRYDDDSSSMNPWVLHPSVRQYRVENPSLGSGHTSLSASSSITAKQQQLSVLGPATKRALDVLQHEIDILSERIDGLRKELMDRDQINKRNKSKPLVSDEDGWKWVFKAAMKHAVMNLLTASVLILVLYQNQSPVAHAILGFIQTFWQKLKLRKR